MDMTFINRSPTRVESSKRQAETICRVASFLGMLFGTQLAQSLVVTKQIRIRSVGF